MTFRHSPVAAALASVLYVTGTAAAAPPVVPIQPIEVVLQAGGVASDVPIGASDPDPGASLTFFVVPGTEPANGTVLFDQAAGTFSYTPSATGTGVFDRFMIGIDDGTTDAVQSGLRFRPVRVSIGRTLTGTGGPDVLSGDFADDVILGGGGNDTLRGDPAQPLYRLVSSVPGSSEMPEESSFGPKFSPDGTKVAFFTDAPAISGNVNAQVVLKDLVAGDYTLVSTPNGSTAGGNGPSEDLAYSPDGTRIAFASSATDLMGGSAGIANIFMKDLVSGDVTLVSTPPGMTTGGNDDSAMPVFSPDGKKIAFISKANDLDGGQAGTFDIFLKDLQTGALTRVTNPGGLLVANGASFAPRFSPDGTRLLFNTFATNLLPGANPVGQVLIKDLVGGGYSLISTRQNETAGGIADSYDGAFSPDGSKVVFTSEADNLGGTAGIADIFLKDLETGALTLFPTFTGSLAGVMGDRSSPSFSPDGSAVFILARRLKAVFSDQQIYKISFDSKKAETITLDAGSQKLNGFSGGHVISADGHKLVYHFFDFTEDIPTYQIHIRNLLATPGGADKLDGGTGADFMAGGGGDDLYVVDNSGDTVLELPGEGTDTVTASVSFALPDEVERLALAGSGNLNGNGNAGANLLTGNGGNNRLNGLGGDDLIIGGGGNDVIEGGPGADRLDGGAGSDTIAFLLSASKIAVDLKKVRTIGGVKYGVIGGDLIAVNQKNGVSSFENIAGSRFADVLRGDDRANVIAGGNGNDRIEGRKGRDILFGGRGRDMFVYRQIKDSPARRPDIIRDFNRKKDRIDLSRFDGNRRKRGRQRFTSFIGKARFTGVPGQLRFVHGRLDGDIDGDRRADFRVVLKKVKTLPARALKLR